MQFKLSGETATIYKKKSYVWVKIPQFDKIVPIALLCFIAD